MSSTDLICESNLSNEVEEDVYEETEEQNVCKVFNLRDVKDDEFVHVSKTTIPIVPINQGQGRKPCGIWISDDSWIRWCSWEMPKWVNPQVYSAYAIKVKKFIRIGDLFPTQQLNENGTIVHLPPVYKKIEGEYPVLRISTREDLLRLHQYFSVKEGNIVGLKFYTIRWSSFESLGLGGVYIDFIYEEHGYNPKKPHSLWYNGWDVTSGCIWHPEAIESYRLLYQPN